MCSCTLLLDGRRAGRWEVQSSVRMGGIATEPSRGRRGELQASGLRFLCHMGDDIRSTSGTTPSYWCVGVGVLVLVCCYRCVGVGVLVLMLVLVCWCWCWC
ncbi:hypothetical protein DICA4_E22870 [Diutina catenulata]